MIEKLLGIAKLVIAILPFVLLCFASRKVNLPKVDRSKPYLMPIIALVYGSLVMAFADSINTWLLNLIYNIPKWIASIATISWMPSQIGSVCTAIGDYLTSLINSLNMPFWIFFISNTVIILVYLIVKKICIAFIASLTMLFCVIFSKACFKY